MPGPLLSNSWYRVADRRPKLRSHARLSRHRYRGEVWHLLQDPASARVHRFTPSARLIISLMDGTRTVAQLWEIANRRLGEHAPTQDEMIELLGQLHGADLLQSDVTPDVAELFTRGERADRARYRRSFANPMALRFPLWDPDAFLNRFDRWPRRIWSRWGAIVWLAVVLPALFLISPHWPELSNNFGDRVLALDNLVVLYLVFPVLKALHEFGHATATKAGGGEVHDMGIIVLVLLPVPYVEASAATVFRSKYQRALVGAAGVVVEIFVAALAFYAWLLVEPGLMRAVLFNVMVIASISTLLFNGNPLLRYDAYYILADLIEIPNLAGRSARYWGYLLERYVLGVPEAEAPDASRSEKAWFVFYGFAATLYRILVTVVIALFIAGRFFVIGVFLALWAVAAMAAVPVIRAVRHVTASPRLRRHRSRAIAITAGIPLVLAVFFLAVPMPYHSNAEGVLWLPEEAIVRAGGNGFLESILVEPGTHVVEGEVLVHLGDPTLKAQWERGKAKVAELEAEYDAQFALIREAASRILGQRHFDPQLMGGWALLQGKLVEMETGEGKTIAATLPASTVALAGYPVHIITVNDYLAERDAEEMGPLYRFLGLSVGTVVQGMSADARREAYARSVTYCSNKELAFDYLRDRVALAHRSSPLHLSLEKLRGTPRDQRLVLRGLFFGIVDEADSVFIDDARTPLILSSTTGPAEEKQRCEEALDLARHLIPVEDYATYLADRNIMLTPVGRARLSTLVAGLDGVWTSVRARDELVTQALMAVILFRRDQHYVVTDEKVQIVDESTGRVMADRSWERGLHQLIEVKEGCEPTQRRETLARLTYQRLFRRYIRLAGMTGTAREVAREIGSVYGLDVVRLPLHRPSRREYGPSLVCATRAEKWNAVGDAVERLAAAGRPVLIGTRSVKASEEISAVLNERRIDHALLNAKQDREEAAVVAAAGEPFRVTVATNMAGRGTDIRLGLGVAESGGLHVILTEYHDSRRVDRQFFGRCARQGDPGSCEAIVSLEDDTFMVYAPAATRLAMHLRQRGVRLPAIAYAALRRIAQFRAERHGAHLRVQNLNLDQRLDRILAFSGRGE